MSEEITVSSGDLISEEDTLTSEEGGTADTVSSGDGGTGLLDYDVLYSAVYDATLDAVETYAQTVTDGQALNATATEYFRGILQNQILPVDYVVYVGQSYTYLSGSTYRTAYEYCMAYGDLEENNRQFTGTGTVVRMRVTGDLSVVYEKNQTISLTAPWYYSRSNLGDYSGIYAYDWSGFFLLISALIGGLTWVIKKLMRLNY